VYLERAVSTLLERGEVDESLLQHLTLLGWEHINLTEDYSWHTTNAQPSWTVKVATCRIGLVPRQSAKCPKLLVRLACSYLHVHTIAMGTIRKTISLPEQIAKRLDKEAKRRKTSVSAIVTELVQQQQPARLPYAGLIDDDENMSQNIEQILARLSS